MKEVALTFQMTPEGKLLLTTEEAARWLGRCPSEFSRLINGAPNDPAVKMLVAGRSGSGKLTRWHMVNVTHASLDLRGREWPIKRTA